MSSTKYIRLCKNLYDKGILVKPEELETKIQNYDREWYTSTYYYNQEQFEQYQKNGSIKGIKNVVADKLWFDFDDVDFEKVRRDTLTLIDKLLKAKIKEESIQVYFSGKKGIHLIIELNKLYNEQQISKICFNLGKDLETFDSSVYDSSQLLRIAGTKHQDTNKYKIPLTFKQLKSTTVVDIKNLASSLDNIQDEFVWDRTELPTEIEVPVEVKKETKPVKLDLDFTLENKPKHWQDYKWALLHAVEVKDNERHTALMRIAATCRGLMYDESITKAFCLAFDEKFQQNTGKTPVDDLESNILPSVFNPLWNGGTYSYKNDLWLQQYCKRVDMVPANKDEDTITIDNAFDLFKDYATNIDELTVKTGIDVLDDKLRMTIGMSVGIVAPPGAGKCLGKGTKVRMYDGSVKNVESIKPGELLMGDDSKPRIVLSACSGSEMLYKIHQNNGNSYIVNESHILSLSGSLSKNTIKKYNKSYYKGNITDVNIKDYLAASKDFKKYVKGYKVAVSYSEKNLPIDPYFLGMLLGDGTSSKAQLTINNDDVELINYLQDYSNKNSWSFVLKSYDSGCKTISVNKGDNDIYLLDILKENKLFNNKHIPDDYLINSTENRLQLIAGLLDTDGYYDVRKNIYEYSCSNENLTDQIVTLMRSVGLRVTKKFKMSTVRYKGELKHCPSWRLYITGDDLTIIPNKLTRKKAVKQEKQRYSDLTEIKVEKLEVGEYYGFEIDGNKRFLLEDFTVTHNTSLALNILNYMSKKEEQCIFFSYDMYHALVFQKLLQRHLKLTDKEIFNKFKNNDHVFQNKALDVLKKEYKNVEFCFKAGQTPEDISNTLVSVEQKTGKKVRLLVVDYNELVISDKSDPTAASAHVAQKLREIANTYNVCVIILMQPNKMAGNPAEEINSYRVAKGSSAIQQSVSIMLGMNRPGYDPKNPQDDNFLTINCLKNRMGALFSADLGWTGMTGEIYELSDEQQYHLDQLRERKKAEKDGTEDGWN